MKYKILDYVSKFNRLKSRKRKTENLYETWGNDSFDGEIVEVSDWFPMDTLEYYEENIKNGIKLEYGVNDIKYEINEHGYRTTKEINEKILKKENQNIIACFGCSQTFGAGLPWNHTWASILNEKLGKSYIVKNYGINGAANDTISRTIFNYLKTETPKAICCFFPESIRMEAYDKDGLVYYSPSFINDVEIYHSYMNIMSEEYGDYLFVKNFNFINSMCQANNVKFYWSTWCESVLNWDTENIKTFLNLENYLNNLDMNFLHNAPSARDNAHFGKSVNEKLAEGFYEKIIEENY